MIHVNVKLDIRAAREVFKGMEKDVNKAAIRALSRVATSVRKEADQEIRQRLALSSSAVKKALSITKYRNVLMVDIDATGKPIAMKEYRARETRKGITFQVKQGAARKLYRRQGRVGFFVDKFGRNVFVRTTPDPPGPQKAKMQKVYGPSIPQYFVTKSVTGRMRKAVAERWPVEFARELQYRMNRGGT